jgi:hypothetical protein
MGVEGSWEISIHSFYLPQVHIQEIKFQHATVCRWFRHSTPSPRPRQTRYTNFLGQPFHRRKLMTIWWLAAGQLRVDQIDAGNFLDKPQP